MTIKKYTLSDVNFFVLFHPFNANIQFYFIDVPLQNTYRMGWHPQLHKLH